MPVTQSRGRQIKDDDVGREDINITTTGRALITKLIAGTNIGLSYTGADVGTGDVTVNLSGTVAVANGGTGATSLTGLLVGNGTAAVTAVVGTASQLLRRNAGNTAYEFFTHDFVSITAATTNTIPKWTSGTALGLSNISDTGSLVTVASGTRITGNLGINFIPAANVGLYNNATITGGTQAYGAVITGTIQSDVTLNAWLHRTIAVTQAASFTLSNLYHYLATQGTFGAGSTVSGQIGFGVESNLIGATNNYGFWGNIAAGTGRWNLYMNGTANNYLRGRTLINTLVDDGVTQLRVDGNVLLNGTTTSVFNSYSNYRLTGVTGGWDRRYGFFGSLDTDRGGFGAFGGTDTLSYYYIGSTYLDYIARFEYATKGVLLEGTLGVNSTTASTSTTTGALRSAGGLGVAGAAWIGGTVNISGHLTSTSATFTNAISVVATSGAIGVTSRGRATDNYFISEFRDNTGATRYGYVQSHSDFGGTLAVVADGGARIDLDSRGVRVTTGSFGVGVTTINASARLQVDSTTQGVLFPRMTQAQRVAISSPANGLIVTQTDGTSPGLWIFISSTWRAIALI